MFAQGPASTAKVPESCEGTGPAPKRGLACASPAALLTEPGRRPRRRSLRVLAAAAAVGLATFTACASDGQRGSVPADTVQIMTWNVQTNKHTPAEWAQVLAAERPDVAGLQEICAGDALVLADLLQRQYGLVYQAVPGPILPSNVPESRKVSSHAVGRPCRDGVVGGYGLAVLSRLPVTSAAIELFAPNDRDEQRGYQRISVRVASGAVLTIFNTHVGLAGVEEEQIRELAAAAFGPAPTLVLGDLNVPFGDSRSLAPLLRRFDEVDPAGRLRTWGNRPDAPGSPAQIKLDYIFYRGLAALSPPIAPWVSSSDHRPLIGTLQPVLAPTR